MKKQPIRDLEKIELIKEYLIGNNRQRDYLLFIIGINSGRRIGDLIKLKVKDVKDMNHMIIKEEKTGKTIRVILNNNLKKEIKKYCDEKCLNEYLFPSRQKKYNNITHIGYKRAYQIFIDIFKIFDIKEGGTHTLRKTFGYWIYKRTGKIEELRIIFGHSSEKITRIYIGVESDEIDSVIKDFGGL